MHRGTRGGLSQVEMGIFLTGPVNVDIVWKGRSWWTHNRSPSRTVELEREKRPGAEGPRAGGRRTHKTRKARKLVPVFMNTSGERTYARSEP